MLFYCIVYIHPDDRSGDNKRSNIRYAKNENSLPQSNNDHSARKCIIMKHLHTAMKGGHRKNLMGTGHLDAMACFLHNQRYICTLICFCPHKGGPFILTIDCILVHEIGNFRHIRVMWFLQLTWEVCYDR